MLPFGFDLAPFQSTDFLVPFLFVLAIVFGSLQEANVFRNRAVNFLVSLALAFFAVSNQWFVNFLWSQFGSVTIFFIAMFFIIFILEAFGVRKKGEKAEHSGALFINGAILFILLSVGLFYIDMIPPLPFIGGGENLFLLFVVVLIVLIFWLAFKVGGPKKKVPVPIPVRK